MKILGQSMTILEKIHISQVFFLPGPVELEQQGVCATDHEKW